MTSLVGRKMISNGSSGSSIPTKINIWKDRATTFIKENSPEAVKAEIELYNNYIEIIDRCKFDPVSSAIIDIQQQITQILKSSVSSGDKISNLTLLKDQNQIMVNAYNKFLNYDVTNPMSECAPKIAYIKTLFDGIKKEGEYLQPPVPTQEDLDLYNQFVQQIDSEIAKLQGASVQAQPAKSSFFSRFGFGGRKQKRTKKGGKKSKRKTKKHKKKRTRRR
jgi:hypothetical protein